MSLQFVSTLVGKHLVNKWLFYPCAPSLSTFRTKWPLNGDVPAGTEVSRLVVPLPIPIRIEGPYHESQRYCCVMDMLAFQ